MFSATGARLTQTLRALNRRPGYALMVTATLALGIGAATAVFALVHSILLTSLPFPEADRLVVIRNQNPQGTWNTSVVDFRALEAEASAFESVAAMRPMDVLVGSGESATWVQGRRVTARFFDVFGLLAARGRTFASGEDAAGAVPVVVVGHSLADRVFSGRDPVGQTLLLDGLAHTVVGVMAKGVEEHPAIRADLWPVFQLAQPERRGPFFLTTVARLKPGVTLARAAEDLEAVSRRLFPIWVQGFKDETARLAPFALRRVVVAGADSFLWVAFGAVAVVLLIALVNVANLMLMRLAQRRADLAIHAALGAGRWRLARLVLSENALLVAAGTIGGMALARVLLAEYRAFGPAVPRLAEVGMSGSVVAFAAAIAVGSAIVFTLLSVAAGTVSGAALLTPAARGASVGREGQRLRDGLVVLEFALALPLLIAAGLLTSSLLRLQKVDPGFDPNGLLTASVRLPESAYREQAAQTAFWARAAEELRALPGVTGVAITGVMPPACGCYNNFDIVGRPAPQGNEPQSPWVPVDSGYFAALGVRLLEGRLFDARDTPDSPGVLLVSERWAKRYFPGESPIGRALHAGGDRTQQRTIVGVVGDVRYDGIEQPGEAVFAPVSQGWGGPSMSVVLRSRNDPLAQARPMQAALRRLEPSIVPADVASMETLLRDALGGQRHWAAVIAGFASSALALAAVGVFGVLAYQVANRQREIGVRQALGADARSIALLILKRGLGCAALGIGLGSVLAAFMTRSLESLLFEIGRGDPRTWAAACFVLLAVAALACWLPAQRAARVDPVSALRHE
jgi:putative ABC transport system permease protein